MLSRGQVHDPGIGFITLTRVQVTPDLQLARVYYTTMGDEKGRKDTAKALQRATPFPRQVGALATTRVPELEFRFDESVAHQIASNRSFVICTRKKRSVTRTMTIRER